MFYDNLNMLCILISLRVRVFLGLYVNDGICCYLERNGVYRGYKHLFEKWPEYSGSVTFPVPERNIHFPFSPLNSYCYHLENGTLWVGEYGKGRVSLLNFLIKEKIKELFKIR